MGWVGELLLCAGVSERKMYGCVCVLIAIFLISV